MHLCIVDAFRPQCPIPSQACIYLSFLSTESMVQQRVTYQQVVVESLSDHLMIVIEDMVKVELTIYFTSTCTFMNLI